MPPNSLNSFLKFFIGFMLLISLSFGITFAVDTYAKSQDQERQTASALQALLEQGN